jgi:14-3-3 protein epsilon
MSVVYQKKKEKQEKQGENDEEDENLDSEGFHVEYYLTPEQMREKLFFHSQLSEEVQDFEALKVTILQLVQTGSVLSESERKLLLQAFKNCVGSRRKAWRVLSQQEIDLNSSDPLLPHLRLYKSEIELEIEEVCKQMLNAIYKLTIAPPHKPNIQLTTHEKVFYYKLQGDYWRYLCEFRQGNQLEQSSREAEDAYNRAWEAVQGPLGLVPADPTLLGLALNMSVFHYEILGNRQTGLTLCRNVYNHANSYLSNKNSNIDLDSNKIKNANDVLKLLRDNLDLWERESASNDR